MYSFIGEGEFVQITLDELPSAQKQSVAVTGFVSRVGQNDSDKDQLLDLFFKSGEFDGANIKFTTRAIHGLSYEFSGVVRRGEAKTKDKEGFFEMVGTLVEHKTDTKGKMRSRKREITMKSFPDLDAAEQK